MSPAFFPSLHRALDAAAAAGQLAGAACEAVLENLAPAPVDDMFDEAAADEYLRGDCGLGALREPPLTGDELVALRQIIEDRFGLTAPADGEAHSARGPAAGDRPAAPPTPGGAAGHPNFTAARGLRAWADGIECPNPAAYRNIADQLAK